MALYFPTDYDDARRFLMEGRSGTHRNLSYNSGEVRDCIYAVGHDRGALERRECDIAFRQWHTNIATWHPDGRITINGYDSVSTISRMHNLRLPYYKSEPPYLDEKRASFLDNQGRIYGVEGYPYGLPGDRVVVRRAGGMCYLVGEEPTESLCLPINDKLKAFNRSRRAMLRVFRRWCRMVEAMGAESVYYLFESTFVHNVVASGLMHEHTEDEWHGVLHDLLERGAVKPEEWQALLHTVEVQTFWWVVPVGREGYYERVVVPSSQVGEVLNSVPLR